MSETDQATAPGPEPTGPERSGRLRRGLGGILVVAVALGAGWWAGRVTFAPPAPVDEVPETVTYTVSEQTVGRSMSLQATVAFPVETTVRARSTGVVTATPLGGDGTVDVGEVLWTVNEAPTVAGVGTVPAYRDLAAGAAGGDVAQLQGFLSAVLGTPFEQTGRFDAATAAAVRQWQRSLGLEATGTVTVDRIAWFPALPARVSLAEGIGVGADVAPGTEAFLVRSPVPDVSLRLGEGQRTLVAAGAETVVTAGESVWRGVVAEIVDTPTGETRAVLTAPGGGPICGDECGALADGAALPARVVVVPETTGPAVPAAAVRLAADGTPFVETPDGERIDVAVLAEADGLAIVDGIAAGAEISVPAP